MKCFSVSAIDRHSCKSISVVLLSLAILQSCIEDKTDIINVSITQYPYNKASALSITFDDGCPSVFTRIVPILEENNLRGTFFIISGSVEKRNEWAKWNDLIDRGHEVGNHSLTHSYYLGTQLDESVLMNEIDSSFRLLESKLVKPPFSFGHPFHSTSPDADEIVFKHHFVSKISPPGFCNMVPLYDTEIFQNEFLEGIQNHQWLVTTAHGIDDCYAPITLTLFMEFIATINAHKDEVFCDTFENLAKYKIESQNTKIDIATNEQGDFIIKLTNKLPEQFDYPLTVAVSGLIPEQYMVIPNEGIILDTSIQTGTIYITLSPTSSLLLRRK